MPYRTGPDRKTRLPVLDRLTIKTPCDVPWDEMVGGTDSRYCFRCSKTVYDLSAMAKEDAEAFLAEHLEQSGELPCARLYRRPDGRILTSECARGERVRHINRVKVGFATATAIAAGLAAIGDHVTTPRLGPDDDETWHSADGHVVFEEPYTMRFPIYAMAMGGMSERETDDDDVTSR